MMRLVNVTTRAGIRAIEVEPDPVMGRYWTAYCPDTYDGAPDAGHCAGNVCATALSEDAVIDDWVEEFNELWEEEEICAAF